jgi:hypothetical protein
MFYYTRCRLCLTMMKRLCYLEDSSAGTGKLEIRNRQEDPARVSHGDHRNNLYGPEVPPQSGAWSRGPAAQSGPPISREQAFV